MQYRNDKVRGRQAELNWTVEKLAEEANVSAPTVVAIRMGRPVTTTKLERVAAALGLSMQELFEPKPETANV